MRLVECAKHGHYPEAEGCKYCEAVRASSPTQRSLGFTRADIRRWADGVPRILESDVRWIAREVFKGQATYEERVSPSMVAAEVVHQGQLKCYRATADADRTRRLMVEDLMHYMPTEGP